MDCRRSPYEGKPMVAPMVRVSTLGFRLMCSREYYNGSKHLPATTPVSSSSSITPTAGTAFFTEEIISMKLMKTKREVRTYNIPLNVPLAGTSPGNTFSLLPPGYMVPWAWAAQELLFSIDDDIRAKTPSNLGHMGLVYKAGEDCLGTASWESHYDGQEELDAYRDLYDAPTPSTTIDATIVDAIFTKESIAKEVEFIATKLLQARQNVIVDPPHQVDVSSSTPSMDEVRRILGSVADAAKKVDMTSVPKAPEGSRVADTPHDIVSTLIGGAVSLDDISAILRELAEERTERVIALNLPNSAPAVQALVTTPLLDSILVPIPIVEFATYDSFKNIVKRTPALQIVQKTLLNPFAEGDYRSVDVRMGALCGVLGVSAESVGSKRQRDSTTTTTSTASSSLSGGVGRVVCQLGAPNALFAAKAAAVVCDDVDGLDLNSGCPKGFSADNNMGAALMSWPVLTGRILGGLNEGANNNTVVARRRADMVYLRQVARLVTPPSQQQDPSSSSSSGKDWFHAEFGLHCPVSLKTRLFDKIQDSERHLLLAVAGAQELVQHPSEPSPSASTIPTDGGAEVDDSSVTPAIPSSTPLPVPHAISLHCRTKEQRSDTLPLGDLGASIVNSLRSVGAITAWIPSEEEGVNDDGAEVPASSPNNNNIGNKSNNNNNMGRKLSKKDKKQQRKGGPAMDLASLIREDAQVKLSIHRRCEEKGATDTTTTSDETVTTSTTLLPTPVDFNTISFVFNGSVVSSNTSGPQPFYGTLVGRSSMWDPSVMGRLGGCGSALPPRTTFNALLINYDEVLCTVGISNPSPPLYSSRPLNYLRKWSIELMKHAPITAAPSLATSCSPYTAKVDVAAADATVMGLTPDDDAPAALQKLASSVHNTLRHMGHMYRSLCLFYGAYRTQISFFKYHLTRSFGEFPTSKISIKELLELQLAALQLTTGGGDGPLPSVLGDGQEIKDMLEAAVKHARVPIPSGVGVDDTDPDANVGNLVRTLFESLQYSKGPIELYSAVESCLALSLGVSTATTSSASPHPQTVRYLLEFAAKEEVVPTAPK